MAIDEKQVAELIKTNQDLLRRLEAQPDPHQAAVDAAREALKDVGLDPDDAREIQADMRHLRDWRVSVGQVKRHGLLALVTVLVTGLAGAVVMGIRYALQHPGG